MMNRQRLLLAAFSGLLQGLAYSNADTGVPAVVIFVALVPLMWAILVDGDDRSTLTRLLVPLYVCFFAFHGVANWWISSWQERTDPYLFASGIAVWLAHPFFLMMPWLCIAWIARRTSITFTLSMMPFVVTAFEWLHGQTDLSYPWLSLGYAVVNLPFVQIADVVGVYGLTFLIVLINVLVFRLVLALLRREAVWKLAVASLTVCVAWAVLGNVHKHAQKEIFTKTKIRVGIVQPNIDPWDKWQSPQEQVLIHRNVSDSLLRTEGPTDITVWSETAIPYTIRNYRYIGDWMQLRSWVDSTRSSLLTGFADIFLYEPGTAPASARSLALDPSMRYDHFNAAMIVNPRRYDVPVHRKTMLTPFAERLPFADQLSFAMKWFEWGVGISAWGKGTERLPLPVVREKDTLAMIGTVICIESIYPDVARDLVRNGANVLSVITNDAWYNGTWGPRQHYLIAQMRAIETRRSIIRCASSGVSGVIDATGTSVMELPIQRRVGDVTDVGCSSSITFYVRYGDWIAVISGIITLLAVIIARIPALLRILRIDTVRQSSHNLMNS